jgi:hypothetical protein
MLVTTPTAETLGVQGFQQMMNAEDNVVTHHMADVISQSFGSGEGAFHDGLAALNQLRKAFIDAKANKVSVFASSGDGGTANTYMEPVKNPALIPYQSIIWPGSDPLVTAVGGTYLCTNAVTGTAVDSVSPPSNCQNAPGDREPGWVASGGGYSIYFQRPSYQNVLPTGSTFVGSTPGAPGEHEHAWDSGHRVPGKRAGRRARVPHGAGHDVVGSRLRRRQPVLDRVVRRRRYELRLAAVGRNRRDGGSAGGPRSRFSEPGPCTRLPTTPRSTRRTSTTCSRATTDVAVSPVTTRRRAGMRLRDLGRRTWPTCFRI